MLIKQTSLVILTFSTLQNHQMHKNRAFLTMKRFHQISFDIYCRNVCKIFQKMENCFLFKGVVVKYLIIPFYIFSPITHTCKVTVPRRICTHEMSPLNNCFNILPIFIDEQCNSTRRSGSFALI